MEYGALFLDSVTTQVSGVWVEFVLYSTLINLASRGRQRRLLGFCTSECIGSNHWCWDNCCSSWGWRCSSSISHESRRGRSLSFPAGCARSYGRNVLARRTSECTRQRSLGCSPGVLATERILRCRVLSRFCLRARHLTWSTIGMHSVHGLLCTWAGLLARKQSCCRRRSHDGTRWGFVDAAVGGSSQTRHTAMQGAFRLIHLISLCK